MKLKNDLILYMERDPACRSMAEAYLLYPGLKAVRSHRITHFFYRHKMYFFARLLSQAVRRRTGIEIHPGAVIGDGLFIDHGAGVVIGETAEIGDFCTLYQGVTLGGTGKESGKRHPTLGDDVLVGAGSKILGPVNIGSHSKIAAGAVVLSDIPENATAVGVPARVVRVSGKKQNAELDQTGVPDPVALELGRLAETIKALEDRIARFEKERTGV